MTTIAPEQLADMIESIARRVQSERDKLNRLDAALGDGDHGTSVSAALAAAVEDIAELKQPSANDIWLTTAKAVMNRMGGASGAIFGTFFLKGASLLRELERVSKSDMEAVLLAGLQGVKARGKAEVGDKTMVDALEPAVKAFCRADDFADAWRSAAEAARKGAESTRELVARRGRAKYLGERAIGHIDPGAASIALIFEAVGEWWMANPTPSPSPTSQGRVDTDLRRGAKSRRPPFPFSYGRAAVSVSRPGGSSPQIHAMRAGSNNLQFAGDYV